MNYLVSILCVISISYGCKEYHFSKKYGYLPERKLETRYYGDHKNGYAASDFLGIKLSSGGGTSYDSIVHFYMQTPYNGPTINYFKSSVFRYGYKAEKVDYYYLTDYLEGRDIGHRFFAFKNDDIIEFGYDYPSKRLKIQFDTLGKPMNCQLFDATFKIDTIYSALPSIPFQVDSMQNELIQANWFQQHFKMTYIDSINGLSPRLESSPIKK